MMEADRKPIVMVVDDQRSNLMFISAVLSAGEDIEVIHAVDGKDALNQLEQVSPDLIVSDIEMPEIDGFELCSTIKKIPHLSAIPLIFVTTRTTKDHIVKSFELGAIDYITKPIIAEELEARVRAHLALSFKDRQLSKLNEELKTRLLEIETYRNDLQNLVDERTAELLLARDQAQAADKAKSDFLASMSHELRTPLTAIIGHAEMLSESLQGLNKEHRDTAKTIIRSGQNQLALVNDILDMSKIESGKFVIDEQPYDLGMMMHELSSMFRAKALDAGLEWGVDERHKERHLLIGDQQRISQILINLIGNAIKFTKQGKVALAVSRNEEQLVFTVTDTGIGMSKSDMDKLFHRFEQIDGSISRRFGGTGLGLYISMSLAELMGGNIEVSSDLGEGSTFCFTLPYRPSDKPVVEQEQSSLRKNRPAQQYSGHVLIAEDTPALQLLERRILEKVGLKVTTANNGKEAIEQTSQHTFDLVLMDMQMPEMDGIEATRRLRQQGHSVPIVALTANVMQKHRDQFEAAGCDGFLAKPIDRTALHQILSQYLQHTEPQRVTTPATLPHRETRAWRILAIDDDSNVLSTYKGMLTEEDSEALQMLSDLVSSNEPSEKVSPTLTLDLALSGEQGFEMVKEALEQGTPYAVVVLDMRMPPGWDGLKTAEKIRSVDSEVRIVLITAFMDYSLSEIRQRIGLNFEFLQKPVSAEEFAQIVVSQADGWGQYRELLRMHNLVKKRCG